MHKPILQSNKHMHKEQWQIVDWTEMSLGVSGCKSKEIFSVQWQSEGSVDEQVR
jgi:hypothetical protein